MTQKQNNIFFGGLNELRAIAALGVIFHHLELYNHRDRLLSIYNVKISAINYFISHLGKNCVYVFFVLSGFLITYLLLNEKECTAKINLKNFYFRRVLRIWPLYYIIFTLAFCLIPFIVSNTDFLHSELYYISRINNGDYYSIKNILLYLFFLSNIGLPVVGAAQSWSVSVEEQFYLIWPLIIKFTNKKNLLFVLILIVLIKILYEKNALPFSRYLVYFPIELMSIGGIFAYFKFYYPTKINYITKNNLLYLLIILSAISLLFFDLSKEIKAIIFSILILFVINEKKINLRNKFLFSVGTISYGLYMYHPFCMFISSAISNNIFKYNFLLYKISFYILTFSFTFIISIFSYHFIEKKILKLKTQKTFS
jgi:peptidoglycan/LPS O-acetylase OafA/YrhL